MVAFFFYLLFAVLIALFIMGKREEAVRSQELQDYVTTARRSLPPITTGTKANTVSKCKKCGASLQPESIRCGGCGHTR